MLRKLIVLVEEYSMEATLELILPKLLGDTAFEIHRFRCKDDLLKQLPARLKAYSAWLPADWAILVLVDRDDDHCEQLKTQFEHIAQVSGLLTKTAAGDGNRFQVANRIAIEELESWFFGDWQAVRNAYPRVAATIPQKAAFRDPDAIAGGTWEAMERVLQRAGYYRTGIRKLELARSIAPHMEPERNASHSFHMFCQAVSAAMAWS